MSTNLTANPFANCTGVTPECPAYYSPLTYQPSLVANFIFLIIFIVCALVSLILGLFYRTWAYGFCTVAGCVLELLGYLGRVKLHSDLWNSGAFTTQIITLIIAPAFLSASIYLTLKHVVLTFGREFSLLKPALYTWIFVSMDILSLLVQAAGAAIFGAKNADISQLKAGANIALAGIILQVVSLATFGLLGGLYLFRLNKHWGTLSPQAVAIAHSTRTHFFAAAVIIAYITILIRCIYRIPELAGGYRNEVYMNQTEFIVLEGVMISIAAICLSFIHPGIFFPQLSAHQRKKQGTAVPEQYIELNGKR
ncbi:RTA1-domain-containing protein [Dissoconium aciculare CBS 342.82]|jgi:hypothetical protein|uniref:RTA1-domain-containing protein n=1 Tax=Dissoconium aciculare CBS 342.82 TaxID=1314786 RepID=A0A6J3MF55_9PEZI|nr:RTA1-domain-containing protein [Dissoconium aciculare CBS 342.82]KAF1826483.1 RTA1-domain-containing protein [Dissoconium aciculare CBS 342.82]